MSGKKSRSAHESRSFTIDLDINRDKRQPHNSLSSIRVQYYRIFRDYLKHEDALINHRLQWNLTIQAFLFATYGFCLQKLLDSNPSGHPVEVAILAKVTYVVLPLVGVFVAIVSFLGTLAARKAITQLEDDWNEKFVGVEKEKLQDHKAVKAKLNALNPFLPSVTGGGDRSAFLLGFYAPLSSLDIYRGMGWLTGLRDP
jgi:hypothetical protein